jgi:hypothetical protein
MNMCKELARGDLLAGYYGRVKMFRAVTSDVPDNNLFGFQVP